MKLTLFDVNQTLCNEWERVFKDYPNIKVICTELDKLESHDLLVTAGNSYGIMTGGIDFFVNKLCNYKAQPLVQQEIKNYWGRLPEGKFVVVDIDKITKGKFKGLIYSVTMEKPKKIPPSNIYNCFDAILSVYKDTDYSIACCGLGTLTGGISEKECAQAMKLAYDNNIKEKKDEKN